MRVHRIGTSITLVVASFLQFLAPSVTAQTLRWSTYEKTADNELKRQLISHLPNNHEYLLCNDGPSVVIVGYDHTPITPNESTQPPIDSPLSIGKEVPGKANEWVKAESCLLLYGKHITVASEPDAHGVASASKGTLSVTDR